MDLGILWQALVDQVGPFKFSTSKSIGLNEGALKLCNLLWKTWFAFQRVKA